MRVVDLFCGSGGFSLGMRRAGFELVAGFDHSERALAVHRANLPGIQRGIRIPRRPGMRGYHNQADLNDVLAISPDVANLSPDVVIGGPPCVAFSPSGKRDGDANPAARLTEAFAVVVSVSRPRYFVMENVFQIQGSRVFARACSILRKAGYGLTAYECHMSWFGVGQRRGRLLLFGCLGEADGWASAYMDGFKQDRQTTVRDVLGDSVGDMYFRLGHRGGRDDPEDPDGDKARRSFRSVDEPGAVITSTATRRATSAEGYVLRAADIRFFERQGMRTLDERAPTFTQRAGSAFGPINKLRKGDVIKVDGLPMLSLNQLAALAGYPPDWNWHPNPKKPTPQSHQVLMMANSVPPPVSELVGRTIRLHARGEQPSVDVKLPDGFAEWLAGPGGVASANVTQRMSEAKTALRMLGSRDLPFIKAALQHLENRPEFKACSPSRRSNLAKGLRLYYAHGSATGRFTWLTLEEAYAVPDEPTDPIPPSFRRLISGSVG